MCMTKIITKFFLTITVVLLISSCFSSGQTDGDWLGNISRGQWTTPQNVGEGKYLVEGYNTRDAMSGGNKHCNNLSKSFTLIDLTPSTNRSRATLIFSCK